jgi:GTP cyclohydrolase IB
MLDVQALPDSRDIALDNVGVTRVALPIRIKEKGGGEQHVQAKANLFVDVPASQKGTHLSRLMQALTSWAEHPVNSDDIETFLQGVATNSEAVSAEVDIAFRYFVPRTAPVSGLTGFSAFDCEFRGRLDDHGFEFVLGVQVPITTLCPCSKEISDYGAHNQRSMVALQISYDHHAGFMWIEDLVELVSAQGSCPVYPILKRPDEKWVTERAYENPKFVEDVVRDVIVALGAQQQPFRWLTVECESQESIHEHNAYASKRVTAPSEVPVATSVAAGAGTAMHSRLSRSLR